MKSKLLRSFFVIIFLFVFIIFFIGLKNSNVYTPKTNAKNKIPFFEAKIFSNNELITSEDIFKSDKFYLMNIWASWCVPCREEHSFLMDLSEKTNIKIIGLNYKDNLKNAKKFLNEMNSPYQIILEDADGTISIEWGAYGVPETFLIHEKNIIKKIIGPITEDSFQEIKKLIK